MKRISIIEKTNLIVILIVVTIGVAFGYTVYARTVRMVDQENRQTVEYVFDLMDSTLSSLYQQVDNLIKNVSLNQEVRHYYQRSTSVDPTENARRWFPSVAWTPLSLASPTGSGRRSLPRPTP